MVGYLAVAPDCIRFIPESLTNMCMLDTLLDAEDREKTLLVSQGFTILLLVT